MSKPGIGLKSIALLTNVMLIGYVTAELLFNSNVYGYDKQVNANNTAREESISNSKGLASEALRKALGEYDQAFQSRNIDALKQLFSPDIVMYEQGTQNRGRDDVLTNHLGPELSSFQELAATYSDIRVFESERMAIITRNFSVKGKRQGRFFGIRGTETQGWQLRDGRWELAHLHWSFPSSH
ncbi:YybH family protein [Geobacter sulfurreducens]|uniref:YybH family protein n=1 Tax=Geobacter sulfurreducens TaxID=35554 RepID=UPI000DBBB1E6|nr:nuclear transport factor 2 family protein [Geobacter sulfurreducens]BBA70605.1 hypothetical protein YM18_2086 [Geobacter sulfurreducens]